MKPIFSIATGTALALMFLGQTVQAQDAEQIFKSRCQICHAITSDGKPGAMAPNLRGVVGRKAATTSFPAYSSALKSSGKVWTMANLDAFLTAPSKLIPGTRMVITTPNAMQRKVILEYISSIK